MRLGLELGCVLGLGLRVKVKVRVMVRVRCRNVRVRGRKGQRAKTTKDKKKRYRQDKTKTLNENFLTKSVLKPPNTLFCLFHHKYFGPIRGTKNRMGAGVLWMRLSTVTVGTGTVDNVGMYCRTYRIIECRLSG